MYQQDRRPANLHPHYHADLHVLRLNLYPAPTPTPTHSDSQTIPDSTAKRLLLKFDPFHSVTEHLLYSLSAPLSICTAGWVVGQANESFLDEWDVSMESSRIELTAGSSGVGSNEMGIGD